MTDFIWGTVRPMILVGSILAQWFCILAGLLMLLMATAIGSLLGAAESLVFLIPAVFLTAFVRIMKGTRI